jgi:hypothetical protein
MKEEKLQEQIHKWRMEEIRFKYECDKEIEAIKFDYQKQLQRIKNADIERNKLRGTR